MINKQDCESQDLRVTIAIQLQQHDEILSYDPTKCYVPDFDALQEKARNNYLNNAIFHRRVDSIYYAIMQSYPSIPPDVAELQRENEELRNAITRYMRDSKRLVLSNEELTKLLAEAKSNSERYKFLRRISEEPELIELLNDADENPQSPDDFDAAIDKAMLAAAPQPETDRCSNE